MSNHPSVDLNALAWLEDYLQTWGGTILVVCVHMNSGVLKLIIRPVPMTELSC